MIAPIRNDIASRLNGFTAFGPVGGVLVIGVGMLALGVPLMIACAVRFRAFFRGETLNEDTRSWYRTRVRSRSLYTSRSRAGAQA